MNWKVLIVDDEVLIAETIHDYLKKIGIQYFRMAHSEEEAFNFIQSWHPDLVILDIRLDRGEEGIRLGKKLQKLEIPFVYITAHSDVVLVEKILETSPNAYLTKPINKTQFSITLGTVLEQLKKTRKFDVKIKSTDPEISQINLKDILYLEASGNYWKVHAYDKRILIRKTFDEINKEFLTENFVRIHRSYIVNIAAISSIKGTNVHLINSISLPVSRGFISDLKDLVS
jgi:two-component system, LytTR family, response regulator LytT